LHGSSGNEWQKGRVSKKGFQRVEHQPFDDASIVERNWGHGAFFADRMRSRRPAPVQARNVTIRSYLDTKAAKGF
jgi:hypothetical protein